ncbi:hypothetical protein Kpho02_67890 [Kitasatospora phosalacinea]|uniref:Uncharacterized protein n=1 Tax=Kitasatospora phosalacinea TaxID=2065 RepID=A0A9W6V492_9ACTN|nr:hypothetical protein [Kitasatospora phosalacinea]GLW74491.1 hypothetical protein Kpho02_67890 [Kitasatospora phosalacinea]
MHENTTLAGDADLAHLVDLIDMLPGPEATHFWGDEPLAIGKKLAFRLRAVLTGRARATDVDYLAVYVLKYLGRGNGYITEEQITKNLKGAHGIPAAGYAWVEDATRTAWILVNRYSLPNWRGPRTAPGRAWLEG